MKNEKKQDKLQDALGLIDEKLVARAARQPMKFATKIKWISSVAAVLVVCIVFGVLVGNGMLLTPQTNNVVSGNLMQVQLVAAKYPQMTKYPGEEKGMAEEY